MPFLEDMKNYDDSTPIFKLIDTAQLYKELGLTVEKWIHTTRLKDSLHPVSHKCLESNTIHTNNRVEF